MRTLTQQQLDDLRKEANSSADFRPSRSLVVDLIEEVESLWRLQSRDGGLPSYTVQLRAKNARLEATLDEILSTLKAHLECGFNSYANSELYRKLLAIAEAA